MASFDRQIFGSLCRAFCSALVVLCSNDVATAACTSPAANIGSLDFQSGAFKYCDGTNWLSFGGAFPHQGPNGSPASPTYSFGAGTNTGLFSTGPGTLSFSTAGTNRLTIDSSGSVGIGTTNPSQYLTLMKNQDAGTSIWLDNQNTGTNAYVGYILNNNTNNAGGFYLFGSNHNNAALANRLTLFSTSTLNGITLLANGTSTLTNDIRFMVGGVTAGYETMRITNSGDVSIGTTAPATKFDVRGRARVAGADDTWARFGSQDKSKMIHMGHKTDTSANHHPYIQAAGGDAYAETGYTTHDLWLNPEGGTVVAGVVPGGWYGLAAGLDVRGPNQIHDSIGNLSIITNDAQGADVGGSMSFMGLHDGTYVMNFGVISGRKENSTSGDASGYMVFGTTQSNGTNVERMRINSGGSIGVATINPGAKFDVNGTVKLGNTGTVVSGIGTCSIASFAAASGANTQTCNGVAAGSPVYCSPGAAPSTATVTWGARASAANTVVINCSAAFTTNTTWKCLFVNP